MNSRTLSLLLVVALLWSPAGSASSPRPLPEDQPVRGIVFDPTDYYALNLPPQGLAAALVARWRRYGINTVYMNAYNVIYGAHYRTRHPFNTMDALGRADFLRVLLVEAHRRQIRVFAGFYSQNHRGAWTANLDWRAKRADGGDYSPRGVSVQYFLSIWHPAVRAWWIGLIRDVLQTYPELDGIELREPVINWWGTEADYNEYALRAFRAAYPGQVPGGAAWRRWRADGLTAFLREVIQTVRESGRPVHLTTVLSSWGSGQLLTPREQADQTGFDLDGVLDGPARPDALKVELIWQQWGNVYDYVTFSPAWTGRAARAALGMVKGRTRSIVHVELTDFGQRRISPEETSLAIRAAWEAGAREFDVYGSSLADQKAAWPWLERAFRTPARAPAGRARGGPARRVLVLEDDDRDRSGVPGLVTALLVNLLGHFDVQTEVVRVGEYAPGSVDDFDAVIYQGTEWDAPLPAHLRLDLRGYAGPLLWIGANLWQLTPRPGDRHFGVAQTPPVLQRPARRIAFNGMELPAAGQNVLGVRPTAGVRVLATAAVAEGTIPVAAAGARFWYVGGYLHPDPARNPIHLIVADLLHDVLRTPHASRRQAVLFITGIDPLVDPARLDGLSGAIESSGVTPALGVTPVFVDSAQGRTIDLRERPEVVARLRALTARGAEIVQAGYTHQFRGQTGSDFEFWDQLRGTARADSSPEMVRERIGGGLQALLDAGLVPFAWATPGGLAAPFAYTLFGEAFALAIERRFYGFAEGRPVQPRFPYMVERDLRGHAVLTPNVFLEPEGTAAAVAAARELRSVRDALAVVAVPVTTPPGALAGLIRDLQALGYEFTPLRRLHAVTVFTDRVAIVSGRATVRLDLGQGEYLRDRELSPDGTLLRERIVRSPTPRRYEALLDTPPTSVRVLEVLRVRPWSPAGLRLRLRARTTGFVEEWETAGLGRRLAILVGWMLSAFSALTALVLGGLYLTARLRRPPARWTS